MPKFSVIVPSRGRSQSLFDCKESLYNQTNQDFEIIVASEEGNLATIRNNAAKRATGQYLVFIDDDVVCSPFWLESLRCSFAKGYTGVSGPAFISREFRKNRDIFKYGIFARLLSSRNPGFISPWGMHSQASAEEDCKYDGPVDYLEACNMAFEKEAFWSVNGFDEQYGGVGEWCEPDLCYRLRALGKTFWFSRDARVEHRPSQAGPYKKRLRTSSRLENYLFFSKRWIKPSFRHSAYKWFMRFYFKLKENWT